MAVQKESTVQKCITAYNIHFTECHDFVPDLKEYQSAS